MPNPRPDYKPPGIVQAARGLLPEHKAMKLDEDELCRDAQRFARSEEEKRDLRIQKIVRLAKETGTIEGHAGTRIPVDPSDVDILVATLQDAEQRGLVPARPSDPEAPEEETTDA